MSKEALFKRALKSLHLSEGGLSDRPPDEDPGGLTNFGITQTTLDRYIEIHKQKGDPYIWTFPTSVRRLDREIHVPPIYKELYWDDCKCDRLPDWAAIMVFDAAVMSGRPVAARLLQRAVGRVAVDGIIGPQTINATNRVSAPRTVIESYTRMRESFLRSLPHARHNPGWFRRTKRIKSLALEYVEEPLA